MGGGSSTSNPAASAAQTVAKTTAQLAEESAKQLKAAQEAYNAAQKKAEPRLSLSSRPSSKETMLQRP